MEWPGLKPDWNGLKFGELVMCGDSLASASFSRILEKVLRFDIGLRFSRSDGSRPSFFSNGVT